MQVQDVVASGTFQQVVNVLGGVPPVRSGQGEVTFVWFCVRQSHSALPIPISYGSWVVLEPLWRGVLLHINLVPQAVFGSES